MDEISQKKCVGTYLHAKITVKVGVFLHLLIFKLRTPSSTNLQVSLHFEISKWRESRRLVEFGVLSLKVSF